MSKDELADLGAGGGWRKTRVAKGVLPCKLSWMDAWLQVKHLSCPCYLINSSPHLISDFALDLAPSQHTPSAGTCPSSQAARSGLWTGALCQRGQEPRSMWPSSPALT